MIYSVKSGDTLSKIAGANFENAKYLEDANFSLASILKNYQGRNPFERVKKRGSRLDS